MSNLTKKNYEAIAATIASQHGFDWSADVSLRAVSKELADYFAQDNPKFDRTRFLQACGIEQKKYTAVTCDVHKNYSTECDCNLIKSQT